MPERTPATLESELRISSRHEELSVADETYIQRISRKHRRRTLGAFSTLLCTTTFLSAYHYDATVNEQIANESSIYLKTIEDNNSDTTIIFSDGFNTINANYLAQKLGPSVQQISDGANIESIHTGDAAPDAEITAKLILEYADNNDIEHLSLFGYSIGGISTVKIAVEILKMSDDITIDAIYLASTPDSIDSLRQDKKDLISGLTEFLANIPRSEHSSYIKFLVTLGFHKEDFMPGEDLWTSLANFDADSFTYNWDDAYRIVSERKRPSLATLEQQLELARTDIARDIEAIGNETEDKNTPTIVYLKITEPGSDNIVNNAKSSKNICDAARKADVPCMIIDVEGSQHAEYYTDDSVQAYTSALSANQVRITDSIHPPTYTLFSAQPDFSDVISMSDPRVKPDTDEDTGR